MIETNIIYSFADLRALVLEKTKAGSFFLIFDDIYFEEIEKETMITRDVFTCAKELARPINVPKYIIFNVKENYTIKEIYDFVDDLRKDTRMIAAIYNPKIKEVFFLFIGKKSDAKLEKKIKDFIELEEY